MRALSGVVNASSFFARPISRVVYTNIRRSQVCYRSGLQDQVTPTDMFRRMSVIEEADLNEPDPEPDDNPDDVDFDDPLAELADRQSAPPRYEIATYPADFTLEVLKTKWDAGEIIIPLFQRGFVWSQAQASKL